DRRSPLRVGAAAVGGPPAPSEGRRFRRRPTHGPAGKGRQGPADGAAGGGPPGPGGAPGAGEGPARDRSRRRVGPGLAARRSGPEVPARRGRMVVAVDVPVL